MSDLPLVRYGQRIEKKKYLKISFFLIKQGKTEFTKKLLSVELERKEAIKMLLLDTVFPFIISYKYTFF